MKTLTAITVLLLANSMYSEQPLISTDTNEIRRISFGAVRKEANLSADAPLVMMNIWYHWLTHGSNFYCINPDVVTNPPSEHITVRVRLEDTIKSRPTDKDGLGKPRNATKYEWTIATVQMSLDGTIQQISFGDEATILPDKEQEKTQQEPESVANRAD